MLEGLALLLLFQLFGEVLNYLLHLPLPGPVIGMVALFLAWPRLGALRQPVESVGSGLLAHLGLLFVPAGVGVMLHLGLITTWWAALLIALLASTAATMALVAWLFGWLSRRHDGG